MSELPTIAAVREEARRLQLRAEAMRAVDPYAKAYAPSEDTAAALARACARQAERELPPDAGEEERKAARANGPARALEVLAFRAARLRAEYERDRLESERALERLARRRRKAALEREAALRHLSLGQRLDLALAALSVVAAAPGAGGFDPVVRSTHDPPPPPFTTDPAAKARRDGLELVRRLERDLDRSQRRQLDATG